MRIVLTVLCLYILGLAYFAASLDETSILSHLTDADSEATPPELYL